MGETVSIELFESKHRQWSKFRKSHRYEIRKAQARGVRVYQDTRWEKFNDFVSLYAATMERVRAAKHYCHTLDHFVQLRSALGDRLRLFVAEYNGAACCASLFVHTCFIVQYHLSGSNPIGRKLAASKLIVNEARP